MIQKEENEEDLLEEQLKASEKYAEAVGNYIEELNEKAKKKNYKKKTPEEKEKLKQERELKKLEKAIEEKVEYIREDLKEQLCDAGMFGKQYDDMVENYLYFVRLKEKLQYDIKVNGIRYQAKTGNGYLSDKPNESIKNLTTVNAEMRSIIKDLGLNTPKEPKDGDDDDLL